MKNGNIVKKELTLYVVKLFCADIEFITSVLILGKYNMQIYCTKQWI